MPRFTPLRPRQLPVAWEYSVSSADHVIWKLVLNPDGVIVGEERDPVLKRAALFAVEIASGRVLWRGIAQREAWWFTSEIATRDVVLLQHYPRPDLPDPRGVTAVDIETGRELWTNPDVRLLGVSGGEVLVEQSGFFAETRSIIKATTGEAIRDLEPEERAELDRAVPEGTHFPDILDEEDTLNASLRAHLAELTPLDQLRGAIEYLTFREYLIASYHTALAVRPGRPPMLRNSIVVIDRETGKRRLEETLTAESPFPVPNNFFVTEGRLLFVKDRRTLEAIELR